MNYLAHFYLSGNDHSILIGNYLGDFIKGNKIKELPKEFHMGIFLHREIDKFTDTHDVVRESVGLLRNDFGKYAGVAVDVFYDHFLARAWENYHSDHLQTFAREIYAIIPNYWEYIPDRGKMFYNYMNAENILWRYKDIDGIEQVMYGMASRTRFPSNFEKSRQVLLNFESELEKHFQTFFPDLVQHCESYLNSK